MAKQPKRQTRAQKIAASKAAKAEELAERKKLEAAVVALGDRVAVVEAASGIVRADPEAGPKPRPGRNFIGQKDASQ